ncbi:MAG TPA: hypothetical protein VFE46_06260 [Pirellulales bacterium]|jgi:hypothetical protein|nr:hypothetical protein [Pirellulales bacterium]
MHSAFFQFVCRQWALPAALIASATALLPKTALADTANALNGPHGDTVPALVVILCLALALIIVVRSSGRHTESKLEKYDEE